MRSCFYSKEPGAEGGRNCLIWFIISFIPAIILVALLARIETNFGGPIPTYFFDSGSKILYFEFTLSFVVSILCIIVIIKVIRNHIVGLVGLLGLVLSLILTIVYAVLFSERPGATAMEEYVSDYYSDNEVPPPFLEYVQKILQDKEMSCCGGQSFDDYASVSKQWVATLATGKDGHFEFDAPPSCCTKEHKDVPNCSKKLLYYHLKINYEIALEALNDTKDTDDFTKRTSKILDKKVDEEIKERNNSLPESTGYQQPATNNVVYEEISKLNQRKYEEYRRERNRTARIYTMGCGKVLDDILDGKVKVGVPELDNISVLILPPTIIAIIKLLLNIVTIGVYIWYYYRFNFKEPEIVVHEQRHSVGLLVNIPIPPPARRETILTVGRRPTIVVPKEENDEDKTPTQTPIKQRPPSSTKPGKSESRVGV